MSANSPAAESDHLPKETPSRDMVTFAGDYLIETLRRHHNEVSADHETAVRAVCELSELVLTGRLSGRFRVGLPCGMGKTTGVRSVARAIALLGLPYRIAVACSKVEELCDLKRKLVRVDGVPSHLVGLMHSYTYDRARADEGRDGFASEPSEGHDRPILLVTHANAKAGDGGRPWMQDRDLVFFDESLVVGEAQALAFIGESRNCALAELGVLKEQATVFSEYAEAVSWFSETLERLRETTKDHVNDEVRTVSIPVITAEQAGRFRRLRLFSVEELPNLSLLLDFAERAEELRVFTNHENKQALVSYVVSVPDWLQNVIVLDASDPIRELVHHDPRMRRIEDVLPSLAKFREAAGGLSSIKRHDRVKVHFACDAGGRDSMRKAFTDGESTWAIEKLIRLIKSKPSESFLVFTYRDRDGVKYERTLLRAFERAGIEYPDINPATGDCRISVLTWGRETASNDYAYVQNVVLLGVIFQPEESLAGRFLGQVDDLRSPQMVSVLRSLRYSECAHSIYQAINRGRMRQVDAIDGVSQAKACAVYIWHRDRELETRLAPVLNGAAWLPWRESDESLTSQDVARLIVARLNELQAHGVEDVTSCSLKAQIAPQLPAQTWKRARDEAVRLAPHWYVSGHRLALLKFDRAA